MNKKIQIFNKQVFTCQQLPRMVPFLLKKIAFVYVVIIFEQKIRLLIDFRPSFSM